MKQWLWTLCGGVAGNALFVLINAWLGLVEGPAAIWAMAAVFVVFGGLAYFLAPRSGGARVGSGLESKDSLEVELGSVKTAGKDDVSVLSDNRSKGPMKISAKDVDLG